MSATPAATVPPSLAPQARVRHQETRRTLRVRITGIDIEHPHRADRAYLHPGEPLTLRIAYQAPEPVSDVVVGLAVYDHDDGKVLLGANTETLGLGPLTLHGSGEVLFEVDAVPLLDGTYPITVGIHSHDAGVVYDWSEQRHWFEVMNPDGRVGKVAMDLHVKLSSQATTVTADDGAGTAEGSGGV